MKLLAELAFGSAPSQSTDSDDADIFDQPTLDYNETGESPDQDAGYHDPDQDQDADDAYDEDGDDGSSDEDGDNGEDPDHQGIIRSVKDAHLVYKRKCPDDTYEELWIYNVPDMKRELEIRKAILSGTDIPVNQVQSEDGEQTYKMWSIGNAELLHIKGLPN